MDIKDFLFSKDWTNPEDFPIVANDATQARQNIQLLHDEVKNFLNTVLIPALKSVSATADEANTKADSALKKAGGTVTVGPTEPEAKDGLWVDTGNNSIIKYYDTAKQAWTACSAVWK